MDIQDELNIVDSVLLTQKKVLQKLVQQIQVHKRSRPQKAPGETGVGQAREHLGTALRDHTRIQEAIQIIDDNRASVAEMINSARRVQEDVSMPQ